MSGDGDSGDRDPSVRRLEVEKSIAPSESFDGHVESELLLSNADKELRQLRVHFHDGGSTHWHLHMGDQVLYFTEGKGMAQEYGEEMIECEPGDVIHVTEGTRHRHGAMPGADAVHIAITEGETIWDHDPRYPQND